MDDRPFNSHQIMESKTEFDLNLNLERWRESLADSPSFQPGNLDELEVHLRDSVNTLEAKGLSTEESFLIATRRLGQPAALEKEFGKVNSETVWLSRWMWMAVGIFLFMSLQLIRGLMDNGFLAFGIHSTFNAHLIGFLNMAAIFVLFAASIVLLRRLTAPSLKQRSQLITRSILNRPVLSLVGLIVFNISLASLSALTGWWARQSSFSTEHIAQVQTLMAWSWVPVYVAQLILLPIVVVYLCRRQLKARMGLV